MQSEKTLVTIIQTLNGDAYEVINSIKEIEIFMYDEFIKPETFIKLKFTNGNNLSIMKNQIITFYEYESE